MASDTGLASVLASLQPDELALLDWVRPQLDASMLHEIAQADYGADVQAHLSALEDLRYTRRPPTELAWRPAAVLALTRWSTVDSVKLGPEAARRLHLMRLFSCLVLVRVATSDGSPVNSMTPLLESALELGPAALEAAARYLAWCRLHEPGDWRDEPASRAVLTLALVMVSAQVPAGEAPDLIPGLLAAFADEMAAVLADEGLDWTPHPIRELLKLTAQGETRRMFVSLADRCLSATRFAHLASDIRGGF